MDAVKIEVDIVHFYGLDFEGINFCMVIQSWLSFDIGVWSI